MVFWNLELNAILPNRVFEFANDRLCRQLAGIQMHDDLAIINRPTKNVGRMCEFVIISSLIGGIICSHGHVCLPIARSIIDNCSSIIGRIAAAKRSRYLWRCVVIGESQECQKVEARLLVFLRNPRAKTS